MTQQRRSRKVKRHTAESIMQQRDQEEEAILDQIPGDSSEELVQLARQRLPRSGSLPQALHRLAARRQTGLQPVDLHEALSGVEVAIGEILLQKLGSRRCDLWEFLAALPGEDGTPQYTHGDIWNSLWQQVPPGEDAERTLPPMLKFWGELVLFAFARLRTKESFERCRCFERYNEERKTRAMREACDRNHTVESFPQYLRDGGQSAEVDPDSGALRPHGKQSTKSRLSEEELAERFLKRAVDGDSNLKKKMGGMFRAFGNSMFCAVFSTPGEKGLYLVKRLVPVAATPGSEPEKLLEERELLVEAGHGEFSDGEVPGAHASQLSGFFHLQPDCVWVCDHCQRVVGGPDDCEGTRHCVWRPQSIGTRLHDPQTESFLLCFCPRHHVWPDRNRTTCPECDSGEVRTKRIAIPITQLKWEELCR
jgi:hypothetical protein